MVPGMTEEFFANAALANPFPEYDTQVICRHRGALDKIKFVLGDARARTSSRLRTPHSGLRAVRSASNSALLGAVCWPCSLYGP